MLIINAEVTEKEDKELQKLFDHHEETFVLYNYNQKNIIRFNPKKSSKTIYTDVYFQIS